MVAAALPAIPLKDMCAGGGNPGCPGCLRGAAAMAPGAFGCGCGPMGGNLAGGGELSMGRTMAVRC